jgi:hypothetical protein
MIARRLPHPEARDIPTHPAYPQVSTPMAAALLARFLALMRSLPGSGRNCALGTGLCALPGCNPLAVGVWPPCLAIPLSSSERKSALPVSPGREGTPVCWAVVAVLVAVQHRAPASGRVRTPWSGRS